MDKQIEEMESDIIKSFSVEYIYALSEVMKSNADIRVLVSSLIAKGYRKIPEGSVVLRREEYEAHKKLAEAVYEGGAFDHYDNVIKSANILFKERKNLIEDTRKETAEKFAGLAKAKARWMRDHHGDYTAVEIDDIDEIAKEIVEGRK